MMTHARSNCGSGPHLRRPPTCVQGLVARAFGVGDVIVKLVRDGLPHGVDQRHDLVACLRGRDRSEGGEW